MRKRPALAAPFVLTALLSPAFGGSPPPSNPPPPPPPPQKKKLPPAPKGGNVFRRGDGTCWHTVEVHCPPNVACNPPPPTEVACPPLDQKKPLDQKQK